MSIYISYLYYITPIENLSSIFKHGILSHRKASRINHTSIANDQVQNRRENKKVPGGLLLHEYVNLYINARNPMLYERMRNSSEKLCILLIDGTVLTSPGVVIADRNAASDYVTFLSPTEAEHKLDIDKICARYWTHLDNQFEEWEHKSLMCAEVLVPHNVAPENIIRVFVPNSGLIEFLITMGFDREIIINRDMFFHMGP